MLKTKKWILFAVVTVISMITTSLVSSACIYAIIHDGGEEGKLPEHIRV